MLACPWNCWQVFSENVNQRFTGTCPSGTAPFLNAIITDVEFSKAEHDARTSYGQNRVCDPLLGLNRQYTNFNDMLAFVPSHPLDEDTHRSLDKTRWLPTCSHNPMHHMAAMPKTHEFERIRQHCAPQQELLKGVHLKASSLETIPGATAQGEGFVGMWDMMNPQLNYILHPYKMRRVGRKVSNLLIGPLLCYTTIMRNRGRTARNLI